jgi:hypothetical protein
MNRKKLQRAISIFLPNQPRDKLKNSLTTQYDDHRE